MLAAATVFIYAQTSKPQRNFESVVLITSSGCRTAPTRSVGTVIAGQLILTVAHGVAGQTSSQITTINGETFEAKIVAIDTAQDLALLKIDPMPIDLRLPPLVFGQATAGEDAFFVAFNDQQQFVRKAKIQRRLKINTEDIYLKEKTTRLGIEAEVKVEVGNSGGPLVNKDGEIIGVVWSTSRITNNRTWATRVEAASALVDSLNSNPDPRTAKPVACTM